MVGYSRWGRETNRIVRGGDHCPVKSTVGSGVQTRLSPVCVRVGVSTGIPCSFTIIGINQRPVLLSRYTRGRICIFAVHSLAATFAIIPALYTVGRGRRRGLARGYGLETELRGFDTRSPRKINLDTFPLEKFELV